MLALPLIVLSLQTASAPLQSRIIGASLFKNGYSFVTREVVVPASGEVRVPIRLTLPAQGTFWYVPSDGLTIVSASFEHPEDRLREVHSAIPENPPLNATDLLVNGKGHTVHIELKFDRETQRLGDARPKITGKLTGITPTYLIVTDGLSNQVIPMERVYGFSIDDLEAKDDPSVANLQGTLVFKTTGGAGAIRYVSLERGLTWLPSYRIDLLPNDQYRLTSRALVYNELESFNKANMHFVTGYPNLGNLNLTDPLFRKNLSEFLGLNTTFGVGGGGFGGGQGAAMNQVGNRREAFNFQTFDANPMIMDAGNGRSAEGLYFYELAGFDARIRSTTSAMLFSINGKFDRRYAASAYLGTGQNPIDVLQILKFHNSGDKPLTTGGGAIFSGEDLISQASLNYVPVGGTFEVQTSKAFDIHASSESEVTGRDKDVIKDDPKRIYDATTTKTTYTIENTRDKEVTLEFMVSFSGEIKGTDLNPKIVKNPSGDPTNPSFANLTWNLVLKPRSTVKFSATGRRVEYVRNRQP